MERSEMIRHVVSLSGGKDSTATLLLALEQYGRDRVTAVMADTGNEHEQTIEYALDYLPMALDIKVHVVRADFSDEFVRKRTNLARIAAGETESAVYGARQFKYNWTPTTAAHALNLLEPTGNPFLDLCMVRGGFPSRKRQFCTEQLKTLPLTAFALDIIDGGEAVWSWQGIRLDESTSRRSRLQGTGACVRAFEDVGGGLYNYRAILRWSAADVFEAHRAFGIHPNPLYTQAMTRVGCMPCINCGKVELREIARRFPEHISRISEWERLVQSVTRPGSHATFMHKQKNGSNGIEAAVEWAKTTRGGRQFDLLADIDEPTACSSAFGLCE
jgi:3'-phosphoadenosine 5'-phosphosulfate sulfotransferase (PAPS reductase)/FAD synthetase